MVCVPFLLLTVARFLARLAAHGRAGQVCYALLIGLFLWGNTTRLIFFLRDGRGHYLEAMQFIAQQNGPTPLTIGTDHDNWGETMLWFYARHLPGTKVAYIPEAAAELHPPNWFIRYGFQARDTHTPIIMLGDHLYRMVARYNYGHGESGFDWMVYRHNPTSEKPPVAPVVK
jgi:hypothetical protein